MSKKQKIGVGIVIVCVFIIFVVIGWLNRTRVDNERNVPKNAVSVQVDTVKEDTIISKIKTKGIVEVREKEALYVNTPSTIKEVLVEVGDSVAKDQPLIVYDRKTMDDLEQQLKQAFIQLEIQELALKNLILPSTDTDIEKARLAVNQSEQGVQDALSNLKQAEMNHNQSQRALEEAKKEYKNNQVLFEQGALSKVEVEQSYEQLQVLEEKLEAAFIQVQGAQRLIENAKQQKKIAEKSLSDLLHKENSPNYQTQVQTQKKQVELQKLQIEHLQTQKEQYVQNTKSPISGTVLKMGAEKGTVVNPGVPIIEIGDLSKIYIKAEINELDSIDIKEGQKVKITNDALEQISYEGVVYKISPIATVKQGSMGVESVVQVEIDLNEVETILKPGYSVEAEIITKHQEKATVIPILALIKDKDGTPIVYVMKEDYSVEKREVKVGTYADLYVEVEGVIPGEKIIINPNTQVKEGGYVKPIEIKQSGDVQ